MLEAWLAEANMLYLEAPAGVGFSYSTNSSYYERVDDRMTGIADSLLSSSPLFTHQEMIANLRFVFGF